MTLAMTGQGRMGANMVRDLARDNHHILALKMRFHSRQENTSSSKNLNPMPADFDGLAIKPVKDK